MKTEGMLSAFLVATLAAVATIVGIVLPWATYGTPAFQSMPQQEQTINGLLAGFGSAQWFGVALGIAAGWLWAGDEPRKPVAALVPLGLTIIAFTVWAMTEKGDLLGFGLAGDGGTVTLEIGVYVTLLGGVLALVSAALVVVGMRRAAAGSADDAPAGASLPTS
jgi:hypothetical protein